MLRVSLHTIKALKKNRYEIVMSLELDVSAALPNSTYETSKVEERCKIPRYTGMPRNIRWTIMEPHTGARNRRTHVDKQGAARKTCENDLQHNKKGRPGIRRIFKFHESVAGHAHYVSSQTLIFPPVFLCL